MLVSKCGNKIVRATLRVCTLTHSADGFVQIWEMAADVMSAHVVAHINLKDRGDDRYTSGCRANALWLTHY
jgi:hypothetical protein